MTWPGFSPPGCRADKGTAAESRHLLQCLAPRSARPRLPAAPGDRLPLRITRAGAGSSAPQSDEAALPRLTGGLRAGTGSRAAGPCCPGVLGPSLALPDGAIQTEKTRG